jgi:hypothetical protein
MLEAIGALELVALPENAGDVELVVSPDIGSTVTPRGPALPPGGSMTVTLFAPQFAL